MKTAVEWLVEQMKKCNMTVSVHNTSHQNVMDFYKAIEQAKQMEKKQIEKAYLIGCIQTMNYSETTPTQYYNETFKLE